MNPVAVLFQAVQVVQAVALPLKMREAEASFSA